MYSFAEIVIRCLVMTDALVGEWLPVSVTPPEVDLELCVMAYKVTGSLGTQQRTTDVRDQLPARRQVWFLYIENSQEAFSLDGC